MRAGRLKNRIIIQSQPSLTDDYGEEVNTFNDVFSPKCNFKIMSGVELLKAGVSLNTEVATILMRADKRIKHDHLVLHKNNRYEISSIRDAEDDKDIIVTVSRQII